MLNTILNNFHAIVLIGGIGMFGSMIVLFSHRSHVALKNKRDLEYEHISKNFNDLKNQYENYCDLIEYKKHLITKKKSYEDILNIDDIKKKYTSSLTLQHNEMFKVYYKKLNILDLEFKNNIADWLPIHLQTQKYENELNVIFNNLNNEYNMNLIISNLEIKNNFEKICSFFDNKFFQNYLNDLNFKFREYIIIKKFNIILSDKYNEKHNELIYQYNKLKQYFIEDVNLSLHEYINIIENEIQELNIEEATYLSLHEDELPFWKLHKVPKKVISDDFFELSQSKNVNVSKYWTYEYIPDRTDLLKQMVWTNNEINKLYLNSNHTYFWLCQENWWNNIKNAYGLNKIPQNNSNLNKLVDTNIEFKPELNIIHLNHNQLDSFYFDLFVFSWQIYFFQHIYLLQYIIPIIYSVIALLVGYVLYKKIKYAYSCYKQKILKVTFLNWLFDPEILFTTSKLGIFYTITIILLLGILYNFSGFGYWFTFLICGRVFVWNWIKYGIYRIKILDKKFYKI